MIIELGFSRIRADRSTTWRTDGVLAKDNPPQLRARLIELARSGHSPEELDRFHA